LCYVACGRLDGSWEINLNLYDIAPGMLIAQEAGAIVSDFSGQTEKIPFPDCLRAPAIYPQLLALLQAP
jgi:myo-inositol-1(or 4)-monophosphatase